MYILTCNLYFSFPRLISKNKELTAIILKRNKK
jgi:hypothetical protein